MLDKLYTQFMLLLIIAELSYINAKSLLFIVAGNRVIDTVFAIAGSVGFSCVTVLVMRNPVLRWPKQVFPLFDTALVFFGLNVGHAHNLLADPVRFGLTVFMSAFAGLITYSLGIIKYKSTDGQNNKQSAAKLEQLGAALQQATATVQQQKKELQQQTDTLQQGEKQLQQKDERMQQLKKELEQLAATVQQQKRELQQLNEELQQYKEACTCPHCSEVFPSEAAKRSHVGKCKMRAGAA